MPPLVPPLVASADWSFFEVVASLDSPGGDYARDPATGGWRWLGLAVRLGGGLAADEAPWVLVSHRVNAGEHDGLEHRSEIQALLWGVRSVPHPEFRRAADRLRGMLSRSKRTKEPVAAEAAGD